MTFVEGDGRRLPFEDASFDIVYSNSVIEHLGTLPNQREFAREVLGAGPAYEYLRRRYAGQDPRLDALVT